MLETPGIIATAVILVLHAPIVYRLVRTRSSAGFSLTAQAGFFAAMLVIMPFALATGVGVFMALATVALGLAAGVLILVILFRRATPDPALGGLLSAERSSLVITDERQIHAIGDVVRTETAVGLKAEDFRPVAEKEWTLDALLAREDADFDLALTLLVLARENRPGLDVGRYRRKISRLANELREKVRKKRAHEDSLVRAVNRFFFEDKAFTATRETPRKAGLNTLLLPNVLDKKRGHCLSLGALYLVLAREAGFPFHGVSVPNHFFVRYDSGEYRRNVETTSSGKEFPDDYYADKYNVSPESAERGVHLANLTGREVVVEVLNNRASFYYRQGEVQRAMADLNRAISASFNFAAGYGGLGFIHLGQGDFEKAVRHCQEAIAIDPSYTVGYLSLGEAYMRQGRFDDAADNFRKAVECDPEFAQAYTDLGRAFQKQGNLIEAHGCHMKALKLDPRSTSALNNLGIVLHQEGRLDEAVETFSTAVRIDRRFIIARENLAKSLITADRSREAEKEVRKVIRTYMKRIKKGPSKEIFKENLDRFLRDIGHPSAKQTQENGMQTESAN
jgi:tetratricopeptide (TPR) repeat protein